MELELHGETDRLTCQKDESQAPIGVRYGELTTAPLQRFFLPCSA